jgi:hypothetical protein
MYAVLNLDDLSVEVYTTKIRVADRVKCHRNSLIDLRNRIIVNGFRITRVVLNEMVKKE